MPGSLEENKRVVSEERADPANSGFRGPELLPLEWSLQAGIKGKGRLWSRIKTPASSARVWARFPPLTPDLGQGRPPWEVAVMAQVFGFLSSTGGPELSSWSPGLSFSPFILSFVPNPLTSPSAGVGTWIMIQ